MSARPLVSILIPTYNRSEILMGAVKSAWSQTYPDVEILVYDDGSTDRTPRLVKPWARAGRLQYHHSTENRGVGYARNKLLAWAKGEYACWLDSDDMANKWRVEIQLEVLRETAAPFVRTAFKVFSRFVGRDEWQDPPQYNKRRQFGCATTMFRTDLAKKVPYDEQVIAGEDSIWEKAYTLAAGKAGVYLPLTLYHVGRSAQFHQLKKNYRVKGMEALWQKSVQRRDAACGRLIAELQSRGIEPTRNVPAVSESECRKLLERCS